MTFDLKTVLAAAMGVIIWSGVPAQALTLNDPLSAWLDASTLERVQLAGWVASHPRLKAARTELVAVDLAGCIEELAATSLSPRKTVATATITCIHLLSPNALESAPTSKDRTGTPVGARW
jgi:hypothetical protein